MKPQDEKGQALIEYLFVVAVIVMGAGIVINNLATDEPTLGMCRFWAVIVRSVATPCGTCADSATDLGTEHICYDPDAPGP